MNNLRHHYSRRGTTMRISSLVIATLFFVLCARLTRAEEGKLSAGQRTQLENAISRFMAANSVPGVAAAAVVDGQEAWSEGFGMADLENSVPVTPQTLFRLGSVSKSITAAATMHLWEQDRIDLDAPLQQYCPQFPKKEWPISTRQLLGHLAGIRHYRAESDDDPEISNVKHFEDPIAGGIQFFANDPLIAKPGAKFHYSTQGYTLVGCAIEGATHGKYVDYVEQSIFRPAGMSESQWDDRYAIIPHRTRFYSKSKTGSVVNADFLDSSYKIPGGGWLSSADDLARFEAAILQDQIMKRSTRDLMWTPQQPSEPPAPGERTGYALGWGTRETDGVHFVGHGGGQQGTSTFILIVPDRRIGVVVLANMDGVDASGLAIDLMKILVKQAQPGASGR